MLGFYNVIKPTGVSSGYVVNRIKWLTKEKVGHLGTLDPLASGVLPIAVGKATRFFDFFLDKDKRYIAIARFGVETDTLDAEGKVTRKDCKKVSLSEVKNASKYFVGKYKQIPPIYSAKSINGVRAYEAAIKNVEIQLEPRDVEIYSISVEPWHEDNVYLLDIHCKSGTYVRSLIRDIAEKIGTYGMALAIIRKASGKFEMKDALTLEQIETNLLGSVIPINKVLEMPTINLSENEAKVLLSGKTIKTKKEDGEYLALLNQEEFSVALAENGFLKNRIYLYNKESL